jgi:DNA-binding MarR family transcriptional regulator
MASKRPTGELYALLHAAGAVEGQVDRALARIGLSLPKLAALAQLHAAGESMPLGELASRLACVKSNVTQLVDRLEADGLVSREPDPNDRRSRLAVLTSAGRKAFEAGTRVQQQAEREAFGSLSADESQQLQALIAKLQTGEKKVNAAS